MTPLLTPHPVLLLPDSSAASPAVNTPIYLHTARWPPAFQCCAWHVFPQYTTDLHREHGLRATLVPAVSATPQFAHMTDVDSGVAVDASSVDDEVAACR